MLQRPDCGCQGARLSRPERIEPSKRGALAGQWYVSRDGTKYALSPSSGDTSHSVAGHCLGQHCGSCLATRLTDALTGRLSLPSQLPGCLLQALLRGRACDFGCPCQQVICTPLQHTPHEYLLNRRTGLFFYFRTCAELSHAVFTTVEPLRLLRWSLRAVAYGNIAANMHLGCEYVPDLVWFCAASSRGRVIAFTGAQLWLKVDRQTDILTVLSDVPGKAQTCLDFVAGS